MKKQFTILLVLIFILGLTPINFSNAQNLADRLKGKILLQVEDSGQAWYIDTETKERAFLGRPADAFRIMRELGLGISEADYHHFGDSAPDRLSGKILLRVEANGEAYYVNPDDSKMHYLGRPVDAFNVMRTHGLGITNNDLETVPVFQKYKEQIEENTGAIEQLTQRVKEQEEIVNKLLEENNNQAEENKQSANLPNNSIYCNGQYWTNCSDGQKFVCPSTGGAYCEIEENQSQIELNQAINLKSQALQLANKNLSDYNSLKDLHIEEISRLNNILDALTGYSGEIMDLFSELTTLRKNRIIESNSIIEEMINILEQDKIKLEATDVMSFLSFDSDVYFAESYSFIPTAKSSFDIDKANYDDANRSILYSLGF